MGAQSREKDDEEQAEDFESEREKRKNSSHTDVTKDNKEKLREEQYWTQTNNQIIQFNSYVDSTNGFNVNERLLDTAHPRLWNLLRELIYHKQMFTNDSSYQIEPQRQVGLYNDIIYQFPFKEKSTVGNFAHDERKLQKFNDIKSSSQSKKNYKEPRRSKNLNQLLINRMLEVVSLKIQNAIWSKQLTSKTDFDNNAISVDAMVHAPEHFFKREGGTSLMMSLDDKKMPESIHQTVGEKQERVEVFCQPEGVMNEYFAERENISFKVGKEQPAKDKDGICLIPITRKPVSKYEKGLERTGQNIESQPGSDPASEGKSEDIIQESSVKERSDVQVKQARANIGIVKDSESKIPPKKESGLVHEAVDAKENNNQLEEQTRRIVVFCQPPEGVVEKYFDYRDNFSNDVNREESSEDERMVRPVEPVTESPVSEMSDENAEDQSDPVVQQTKELSESKNCIFSEDGQGDTLAENGGHEELVSTFQRHLMEESDLSREDLTKGQSEKRGQDTTVQYWNVISVLAVPANWKIVKKLGHGSFGIVYLVRNLESREEYALKTFFVSGGTIPSKALKALRNEIKLLKKLNHKHIVKFHDSYEHANTLLFFMEYMSRGSLKDRLDKHGALSEELACKYTRQIIEGLKYLHSSNILHRDLKGANVLLNESDNLKLADFGIAKEVLVLKSMEHTACVGTAHWMSPEVIRGESYGRGADIWSAAITVYEMLTTNPPFIELDRTQAIFRIGQDIVERKLPSNVIVSQDCHNFLEAIFAENDKRPYAEELLEHAWLKKQK